MGKTSNARTLASSPRTGYTRTPQLTYDTSVPNRDNVTVLGHSRQPKQLATVPYRFHVWPKHHV